MAKEMVVCANPHETRVAILEDGQLCEIYVEREKEFALVGSIYKGRVTRVLPGMQSSFVDIGLDSDAFLYVSDFLQDIEEVDSIVHTVEEKVHKMEEQGGEVFSSASAGGEAAAEPADVSPLPGETIGSPAPRENRPEDRAPWQGGRGGFGRRAGGSEPGGGFRGGRDRGRGGRGRPGRGGRDRGRGGRFHGRELPESKYAPSHGYDREQGSSAGPFEPVLLPGESLSVVREHTENPSTPPSTSPDPEASVFLTEPEKTETLAPEPAEHVADPERVATPTEAAPERSAEASEQVFEQRHQDFSRGRRERHDQPRSWATSLEPLPGESLAKTKLAEHEPAAIGESNPIISNEMEESVTAEPHSPEVGDPAAVGRRHETAEPANHEENSAAELTDEEATALAEHVAEAQQEEAEREAEEARAGSAEFEENGSSNAEASDVPDAEDAGEEGASHDEIHDESNSESEEAGAESEEEDEENGDDLAGSPESQFSGEDLIEENAEEISARGEESGSTVESESSSERGESQQPMQARVRGDFRARMQHPARRGGRDRERGGRRHFKGRGGHHRGQPKRNQLISELLKAGQEIIVQIAKEPLGKKGARITSHIALPGRFLVYMPTLDHTGVSRKIASAEERSRLRHLVTEAKGSSGGGFIVRTAAASAAPEEVRADVEFLTRTWAEIKSRSDQRKAPSLLHRDLNLVERILRDYLSTDYTSIWVDSEEEYTKILEFVSRFQPQLANRVKLFTKSTPIFEEFGIQQEIDKGLRPKVWLKSGGYIVINHTEALVAIDVNTGKFVGRGSTRLEDTIVRTNTEAVKEIVRQIRLRDLGGIIIIDFIDMEERRNREKVMAALEEALKADRAPSKVLRFNEFGLVAITRKRTKQALERTLCQPCPYCTGSGMVKSIPTLCYEIQSEARKMAPDIDAASITLRVHPEIAKALKTRESSLIEELEQVSRKSVIIQADPTLHWEQYDIY